MLVCGAWLIFDVVLYITVEKVLLFLIHQVCVIRSYQVRKVYEWYRVGFVGPAVLIF